MITFVLIKLLITVKLLKPCQVFVVSSPFLHKYAIWVVVLESLDITV